MGGRGAHCLNQLIFNAVFSKQFTRRFEKQRLAGKLKILGLFEVVPFPKTVEA
jgi:hypothetical protein